MLFRTSAFVFVCAFVIGCADEGTPANLPLVTPPVRAAVPSSLGGQTLAPRALDSADVKSRFFSPSPTSVFRILEEIDGRVASINDRSQNEGKHPCIDQAPVAYTLTPWGQSVTFYAQCYETIGNGFLQFAKKDDVTYLFVNVGSPVAARIAPVPSAPGKYTVHAWLSIGDGKTEGSYGVIELEADETRSAFEMTVAGIGFGYCGAQLKSDGQNVFGKGSLDRGATCQPTDTFCGAAKDVALPGTCGAPLETFSLPPLGRKAGSLGGKSFGASEYPGASDSIVLDGSPAAGGAFRPTGPTGCAPEFSPLRK